MTITVCNATPYGTIDAEFATKYPKMIDQYKTHCKLKLVPSCGIVQYDISDNEIVWAIAWEPLTDDSYALGLKNIKKYLLARNKNRPELDNSIALPFFNDKLVREILAGLPNEIVFYETKVI